MSKYDEQLWELTIQRCDDGDLLIGQGVCCGCDDDLVVRLHRCHFPLVAKHLGLMAQEQCDNAAAKANGHLQLLAGLIDAHLPPEHPLVRAAAVLLDSTAQRNEPRLADISRIDSQQQLSLIEE